MMTQLPDTPEGAAEETVLPPVDAYSLLTKPTLEITDAEVDIIVADLRRRRANHLASGKPDKPAAEAKAKRTPKGKPSQAAKDEATKALLADIDWKL
jgi:hypothetical protein